MVAGRRTQGARTSQLELVQHMCKMCAACVQHVSSVPPWISSHFDSPRPDGDDDQDDNDEDDDDDDGDGDAEGRRR